MNIQIATGDITAFSGDATIIPCDTEISYAKLLHPNPNYPLFKRESKKSISKNIFEAAGKDLVKEATTVGYCEIGNAVITKGYDLKVKHVIFMPLSDHTSEDDSINYVGLHQSLRSAFTLANLYKVKALAIAGIRIPGKRRGYFENLWYKFMNNNKEDKSLSGDEIEDIIIAIAKDFDSSSIKELSIYKYSK